MLIWMEARNKAREIRTIYGLNDIPDLSRLCDELGINVCELPLGSVSGLILKKREEEPAIYINAKDCSAHRRLTLAHELGHYFERLRVDDDEYSFRDKTVMKEACSDEYGLMEFYADEFAGELLMPEEVFTKVWARGGSLLAAYFFGVSPVVARKRNSRLKYSKELLRGLPYQNCR